MSIPPLISQRQSVGKKCTIAFIASTVFFDLVAKIGAFVADRLSFGHILGTFLTALLLIFLWRGVPAAWWIAVTCIAMAVVACTFVATSMPWIFTSTLLTLLSVLLTLLILPHTRDFLAFQKAKSA